MSLRIESAYWKDQYVYSLVLSDGQCVDVSFADVDRLGLAKGALVDVVDGAIRLAQDAPEEAGDGENDEAPNEVPNEAPNEATDSGKAVQQPARRRKAQS